MKPRANPYAQFFALAKEQNIDDELRKNLVRQYTNDRTDSLKDMKPGEYYALVNGIRGRKPATQALARPANAADSFRKEKMNLMRKKIFSLCYTMGYVFGSSQEDKKLNAIVVNGMVKRLGYLKPKGLNNYTFEELPKLVSQFEHMAKNNDKTAARKEVQSLLRELNLSVQ